MLAEQHIVPSPSSDTAVQHTTAYNQLIKLIEKVGLSKRGFATRLEMHGFGYNESAFANWMRRGIPSKDGLLKAIVEVLVGSSSAGCCCTAEDALLFLAPAGFPFADLRLVAPLFPQNEFRTALLDAMPLFVSTPDDSPFPGRLPVQRTSFIGREQACAQVWHLLIEHHLVTLWGTGGCGKTRLAVQVASEMQHSFRHGVCFVDLSTIRDPDLVLLQIAQALHLKEIEQQSLSEQLATYLASRHGLLVLDNFEHVIEATPTLIDLLDAAPLLHILVTSREPLHLYGEWQYEIPPLSLPAPARWPARWDEQYAMLQQSEAICLFVERARAAKFHFALTSENAPAVAELCGRLEGLPLLIELAASRSAMFSPQEMVRHIQDCLSLASSTMRNFPPRQRSAAALIGWSYDLLSPDEQALFARLAIFAGSFTLAAAEAVCTLPDDRLLPVLAGLESLMNKSLLRHKEGMSSEARFLLLEPVREYASMRLQQSGQADLIAQRHAAYYLDLAKEAADRVGGRQQDHWICQLEQEHDNFRTVLGSLLAQGEAETAFQLCATLELFWYWCGYQREGRMWLERVLTQETLSESARAKALDAAGGLAWALGEYAQARALAEQSLALWQTLDNTEGIVEALNTLGLVAESLGDLDQAIAVHGRGLALRRELGNPRRVAVALGNLGDVELYHQPALPEQAIARFNESLAIYESLEDRRGMADMLVSLGDAALFQNNHEQAAVLFRQSLTLYEQVSNANRNRILRCLERLPVALTMMGQTERGARLLGAATALRRSYDIPRSPIYEPFHSHTVEFIRVRCGEATFTQAFAQGETLTLDQAITEVFRGTASLVTLCHWAAQDIAQWRQEAPTPDDDPAARVVLISPRAEPLTPCHTVIPSWQATTPPGTWIELHLHGLIGGQLVGDHQWTRTYRVVAWDTASEQSQRRSFDTQRDTDGWVDTETLRLTKPANAVQVRVVLCAEQDESLPELHRMTLCLSARSRESQREERGSIDDAPLPVIEPLSLPAFSQYTYPEGDGWCSPTALAMVLGYWHHQTGDSRMQPFCTPACVPDLVAPMVHDANFGSGNWSFNIAYATSLGLDGYVTQLFSLHQVARWIAAGVPVVCSLAWEEGELVQAPQPRSDGHLVVVTGLRPDGQVVVADPAGSDAEQVHRQYQGAQFTACWQRHSAGIVYLVYPLAWPIPRAYIGDPW
jgi:predicted ATPase